MNFSANAQELTDSISAHTNKITQKYIGGITTKSEKVSASIDRQTEKYLTKLQKIEARIADKLSKIDKVAGQNLLSNSGSQYQALTSKLTSGLIATTGKQAGEYLPYLDSMKGSLSFLQQDKYAGKAGLANLGSAISSVNQLQNKLQEIDEIKQFITERKQQIRQILSRYTTLPAGLKNSFQSYNKQAYYYAAQIREYKELLNDPDKMERKALVLLNQLPAFQTFMKDHSELSSLFNLPSNYGSPEALLGLQTRDQVQQMISSQLGAGPNVGQLLGQQVQTAKSALDGFKNKLNQLGKGSGDIEMPDFKPNQQKTKPFLQRLEYGTNMQTQRSGYFFPTTTDLALSVGYKLSNKNIIGVGMSYKVGWGKDLQHIALSSEGIGIRSFLDMQVHKTFFASGGFEYNYQQPFGSIEQIKYLTAWQQSGLIGVSKIVSMKTKVFKKTKLQLLWDFLSYEQRPVTQPIKFRVGYNF